MPIQGFTIESGPKRRYPFSRVEMNIIVPPTGEKQYKIRIRGWTTPAVMEVAETLAAKPQQLTHAAGEPDPAMRYFRNSPFTVYNITPYNPVEKSSK